MFHATGAAEATLASLCLSAFLMGSAFAASPALPATGNAAKVKALVARMTPEEKLLIIRGAQESATTTKGEAGYLAGIKRLNIPPVRFSDGPPGILVSKPSTATVATMALAATFSTKDARDNGEILADEAKRLDISLLLEPFINMDRDITFFRAYNTYGEDPVLTGAIGAAMIRGLQDQGVMAEAKHFIGFSSTSRGVKIDDQALHEVYLAPFADAISAGVSSIMCSYNQINGHFACGNRQTLTDILRGQMGFDGFVTSDWGAVHSGDDLVHGLDLEMPGKMAKGGRMHSYFDLSSAAGAAAAHKNHKNTVFPTTIPEEPNVARPMFAFMHAGETYRNLGDSLKDGTTKMADVDRAAERVLGQIDRFGYLDGRHAAYWKARSGLDLNAVNRRTADDAAVLLKNAGHILPLENASSVAMIGPGARQVVAIGKAGERGMGFIARQIGPYAALRNAMPHAKLTLAVANDMDGRVVPATRLTSDGQPGLTHLMDGKVMGRDATVDFTKADGHPLAAGSRHAWRGQLEIREAGTYGLYVQSMGGRAALYVDGKKVVQASGHAGGMHGDTLQPNQDNLLPTTGGLDNVRIALPLDAGKHNIRVTVTPDSSGNPVEARFAWMTPQQKKADFAAAVAAAKKAKTAIVFVWSRGLPDFGLPGDQNKLVEAVAAVNPNTVVVLNTSQPVAMPWQDKVKGIVEMWWPGDEGGRATADILSGKVSPGGHLPFTWGKKLADYAANDPKHPERAAHGLSGTAAYSEGVDIGYRWFDKMQIAPLYPFGFGLSYTHFAYSALSQSPAKDGGLDVRFTVRNAGAKTGDVVPQIYLSAPSHKPAGVQFAPQALAGFTRVTLKPGESRLVSVHVGPRHLQYWSTKDQRWVRDAAGRKLTVGASSRDPRLQSIIE